MAVYRIENRMEEGLLCWGSTPSNGEEYQDVARGLEQAILESGLDNTYVYDDATYVPENHICSYIDVGLSALYAMDCDYLAKIASTLGYRKDARELSARGESFRKNLQNPCCS